MKQMLDIRLYINNQNWFNGYDLKDLEFEVSSLNSRIGQLTTGNETVIPVGIDTYTPTLGDKYYFLPGVNIPRVKLKNLTKDYKIKVVREITEATHVFYGKKSEDRLTDYEWSYSIKTENFKSFFEAVKDRMDVRDKDRIETALEFYTHEVILTDYNTLNNIILNFRVYAALDWTIPEAQNNYNARLITCKEDHKEVFPLIAGCSLYKEEALLFHLNGDDAVEIDEAMYDALTDMFNSSDVDNHTLAMEIMANSHYDKSLLYLELLFYKFSARMSNCKAKNHVNFKSLVSFLNKDGYFGTSIDDIVSSLLKFDKLTPDNLNTILGYLNDDVVNGGNTTHFTVKSISVNPELLEKMNTNYEFIVQKDIEVIEVQEEPVVDEVPEEIAIVPETIKETPIADGNPDFFL